MKATTFFYIVIMMFLAFFSLITPYIMHFSINGYVQEDLYLKNSVMSEGIHINNNWTAAIGAGICTGSGTYSDPYIIKDFEMHPYPGWGIRIENSSVNIIIKNCTIGPTGLGLAGIDLINVNNSKITNNSCIFSYNGICLESSHNNTITDNFISDDEDSSYSLNTGIILNEESSNNHIYNNTVKYCGENGIFLWLCDWNSIQNNLVHSVQDDGIQVSGGKNNVISNNIIRGSGREGILIVEGNYNNILRNQVSDNRNGIYLHGSSHNTISENIIKRNQLVGIYLLRESNNNFILHNSLSENGECIKEERCSGNIYFNNGLCIYIGEPFLGILISIVLVVGAIWIVIFLWSLSHKLKNNGRVNRGIR